MRTIPIALFAVSAALRASRRWRRAPVCRARRFGYSNDAAGRRTAISRSGEAFGDLSGATDAYGYNLRSEVVSARRTKGGAPVRGFDEDFSYDPIGNRVSTTNYDEAGSAIVSEYTANNLNQYTSRTVPGVAAVRGFADADATVTVNENPTWRLGEYFYGSDAFDNSAAPVDAALVTTAALASPTNGPDEVASATSRVHIAKSPQPFEYDDDGNQTLVATKTGVWRVEYDAENRVLSATSANLTNGALQVVNTYDGRHRRISCAVQRFVSGEWRCDNGGDDWWTIELRRFFYDGRNLISEIVEGGGEESNQTNIFCWGLDLELHGSLYRPTYDGNGNVVQYLSDGGDISASYEYDAFGNVIILSGAEADQFAHCFSTKYYDSQTDLVDFGRRFYVPVCGRWINRDPIEEAGGIVIYSYVNNSPLYEIDSLGLSTYNIFDLMHDQLCEDAYRKIGSYLSTPQEKFAWDRYTNHGWLGRRRDIELSAEDVKIISESIGGVVDYVNSERGLCKNGMSFSTSTSIGGTAPSPWIRAIGGVSIRVSTTCTNGCFSFAYNINDPYDFDIKGVPGFTSRSFSGEIATIGVRFTEICLQCGWQTFYHKGVYYGK